MPNGGRYGAGVSIDPQSERHIVEIERLVAGGDGLARDETGRIVLVRQGLVGECLVVTPVEVHRRWSRAEIGEVLSPSRLRITPPCPARLAGCGGCDWQHLDPEAQLSAKVDIASETLMRLGRGRFAGQTAPAVQPGGTVPAFGYRTTVRVVGGADARPMFRIERSTDLVAADRCLIADPAVVEVLSQLRLEPNVEAVVRIGRSSGERSVWWQGRPEAGWGLDPVVRVGATAQVHERVAGVDMTISAASFFQSGPDAAELLITTLRRSVPEIESAQHLVDAYAGIGLFASTVSAPETRLTLIESSAAAIADAKRNLAGRHAEILHADVETWRPPAHGRIEPVDVLIADPSRRGLGSEAAAAILAHRPEVIALISCDIAAGVRDLTLLTDGGYRVRSIEVLDLFPQTHHLELVSVLEAPTRPMR